MKTKLEKPVVEAFLLQYDIVSLSETKTNLRIRLPGFEAFQCVNSASSHRGGTVVMVKNSVARYVTNVDYCNDQVWLEIKCIPNVLFGFCSIPPQDSEYFTHQSFATIQEKVTGNNCNYVVMGDLNSRFGASAREILFGSGIPDAHKYEYPTFPDNVNAPNGNAYVISTLCIDNKMLAVNNLKTESTYYQSDMTFRKNGSWVSELDVCLASHAVIKDINSFCVHKEECLPSDHAPISIKVNIAGMSLDCLYHRACQLGGHVFPMSQDEHVPMVRKPIKFTNINKELFCHNMNDIDVSSYEHINDVNAFAKNLSDTLYECARGSRETAGVTPRAGDAADANLARWDRLLQDTDDKRVWQAINWKGCLQDDTDADVKPSDEEFRSFYDHLMNVPTDDFTDICQEVNVTIPVLDSPISPDEVASQINKMKADKSCGPDGIAPGVFKLLSAQWVLLITTLFNVIFATAHYPTLWSKAKFHTIFKKGIAKTRKTTEVSV